MKPEPVAPPTDQPQSSLPASVPVPQEDLSSSGIRVLLVSDQRLMRAALRLLLASRFNPVAEAATGEEAMALAERYAADVILLDLGSGVDLFACMGALRAVADRSRVIVLADRTRVVDLPELIELGAVGLVLKDDSPEMLVKAIRKVHAGEIWLERTHTADVLSHMARRRRVEDAEQAKIASLTKREHEIVGLIGEGLKNVAIARRLFISEATVRNHLTSIFEKLGLADRFELAVYAFRHGLVEYPSNVAARQMPR